MSPGRPGRLHAERPLLGNQPPVPTQDRVRRHDGRHLSQTLTTESLGFRRQAAALVVSQPNTPPPQLPPKAAVLLHQILDYLLLLPVDPSG
jgi:hypothetical protein